jgi:hypothetical protein
MGAIIQFSPTLAVGETFNLPEGFKTASICPVGTGSSYTITTNGVTSPVLLDITSFPQIDTWGNWEECTITCIAGTVNVKYFNAQI